MQSYTADQVFEKLGFKIRPLRDQLVVVTDLPIRKVGSLFLPMKAASFYGDLPHLVHVRSTVIATGPKVSSLVVGDRVSFPRTYFTRLYALGDDVMVGLVSQSQVVGRFTEEPHEISDAEASKDIGHVHA